ncbi:MAG: GNAT family N-acetyltransferase [Phycisphaeraceae bacterium]|nr:GNAT family N-acetyltransferase [Phycisphaerales bacterium]MCB9860864.1 GNAT family N-acetyltransferase [Phycisphaeraceae bacterium]
MQAGQDWIKPTVLELPETNALVRLIPLDPDHTRDLFHAATPDTFNLFSRGPEQWTEDGMRAFIEYLLGPAKTVPFSVIHVPTQTPIGITTYLDIKPLHKGAEVGWTWITPEHRGTKINPAMKLLMLQHAFERLDAIRVCLKTDERNLLSQHAIEKLGAKREGIMRHTVIMRDGFRRSSAMYSILADEWPVVKQRLIERLH